MAWTLLDLPLSYPLNSIKNGNGWADTTKVACLCLNREAYEVDPIFRTTPLFGFLADSTVGGRHEAEESEAV